MALCCVCTLCQDASRVTADQYKGAAGGQQRVHRGGGGGGRARHAQQQAGMRQTAVAWWSTIAWVVGSRHTA
jgi:hypothetical protein